MKAQVKTAFKSYFVTKKKHLKSRTAFHEALCLPTACSQVPIPISKSTPLFSQPLFFRENFKTKVRINKMTKKYDQKLRPTPSELVYPTMESFEIYGVQITGKCICQSKKLNVEIFIHAPSPRQKSPQILNTSSLAKGNYASP